MPINSNQFAMTAIAGLNDLQFQGSVVSCEVAAASADIVAGQAVKLATTLGGVPKVNPVSANTDNIFGIALYNRKDAAYSAGKYLEVGLENTVVYMTAGGAIARGANVEYVAASNKVIAAAGVNTPIGFAFDGAAADGDLIRVYLKTPNSGASANVSRSIEVTATLAEINAGKVLIPGAVGKRIRVTNFVERVVGAFTTGTSVDLVSDATTVNVESTAQANLTNGAVLTPASAGVTLGAGFGAQLPVGEGLKVQKTGSNFAGGTSITFTITYNQA